MVSAPPSQPCHPVLRPALGLALLLAAAPLPAGPGCCDLPNLPPEVVDPAKILALPADADDVTLSWPVTGTPVLNSPFGPRQLGSDGARYDWHRGTDLKMPIGTPLFAPADAYVVFAGNHPSYADPVIQLRHNTAEPYLYTLYLHVSAWEDDIVGTTVTKGTRIGESGQGSASYPHLHWEVRRGCLRQECCENVYGYLDVPDTPPSAPVLEAAGDTPLLGRMVLLAWQFPKDELDFQSLTVNWGTQSRTADVDALNALSPTGLGSLLDDPLYFAEEHALPFAFLPGRFNDTFPAANYKFLAWNLDTALPSGNARVADARGGQAAATIAPAFPPVAVNGPPSLAQLPPGAPFAFVHTVTNTDTVSRSVTFEAISAQSLALDVAPGSALLAPGASVHVTISGALDPDFPEDVGDILLLKTTVAGGSWTPYLSGTLLDTSATAGLAGWRILGN